MVNRQISPSTGRPPSPPYAESVNDAFRMLRAIGWTEGEAGNLVARLAGLAVTRQGWRIREVEGLLFIRSLVSSGRLDP